MITFSMVSPHYLANNKCKVISSFSFCYISHILTDPALFIHEMQFIIFKRLFYYSMENCLLKCKTTKFLSFFIFHSPLYYKFPSCLVSRLVHIIISIIKDNNFKVQVIITFCRIFFFCFSCLLISSFPFYVFQFHKYNIFFCSCILCTVQDII